MHALLAGKLRFNGVWYRNAIQYICEEQADGAALQREILRTSASFSENRQSLPLKSQMRKQSYLHESVHNTVEMDEMQRDYYKKIKVEIIYNSIRLNLVQKTSRYQKMGNKELNQSIYRSTATTLTTQP